MAQIPKDVNLRLSITEGTPGRIVETAKRLVDLGVPRRFIEGWIQCEVRMVLEIEQAPV